MNLSQLADIRSNPIRPVILEILVLQKSLPFTKRPCSQHVCAINIRQRPRGHQQNPETACGCEGCLISENALPCCHLLQPASIYVRRSAQRRSPHQILHNQMSYKENPVDCTALGANFEWLNTVRKVSAVIRTEATMLPDYQR